MIKKTPSHSHLHIICILFTHSIHYYCSLSWVEHSLCTNNYWSFINAKVWHWFLLLFHFDYSLTCLWVKKKTSPRWMVITHFWVIRQSNVATNRQCTSQHGYAGLCRSHSVNLLKTWSRLIPDHGSFKSITLPSPSQSLRPNAQCIAIWKQRRTN